MADEEAGDPTGEPGEEQMVPAIQGTLDDIKKMRAQCLEAGIEVDVAGQPGGGRFVLMVREADIPQVSALLRGQWREQIEREGTGGLGLFGVEVKEGEEPPCPACGTAAPLVEGACSECGLQLE
jgi:hypothetical protein